MRLLSSFLLTLLSGCQMGFLDTMEMQCLPEPIYIQSSELPPPSSKQLKDVLKAHGLTIEEHAKLASFRIEIERFTLNLKALYHESTSHSLFRNIEASMSVAAYDPGTGDLLWEKEYHAVETLRTDPHFFSQNQLAVAQSQWDLQRDLFSQLSTDLLKLCVIQTSGSS